MYRLSTKWILIALTALPVIPVRAGPVQLTTKTLFDSCSSDTQSLGYASCRGYMTEFVRRARLEIDAGKWDRICLPPDVTSDKIAIAFVRVARSREDFLIGPSDRAVRTALEVSFPCRP